MELCYRWIGPGGDLADPWEVRAEVFVREQGFSAETEVDATDPVAHHLVVSDAQGPVATGRIFNEAAHPESYHVGRVAVKQRLRGTGLGREIMLEMERKAKELGAARCELSAQVRVKGFYQALGYQPFGEEYMDEHCPHINMRKEL